MEELKTKVRLGTRRGGDQHRAPSPPDTHCPGQVVKRQKELQGEAKAEGKGEAAGAASE